MNTTRTTTMVADAGPLLDRLTKLARGHHQYTRLANSDFTPGPDRWRSRQVARTLADELGEQIDTLDVGQLRLLLTMLLGRVAASEPVLPPRPAVPAGEVDRG